MGSGASSSTSSFCIYYPSLIKSSKPIESNKKFPSSVRASARLSYHSASTRTAHSVRQIALINHSRQEFVYIPPSQLSLDIRRQAKNAKSTINGNETDSSIRSQITIPSSLPPSTRFVSKNNSVRKAEGTSSLSTPNTDKESPSITPSILGPQLVIQSNDDSNYIDDSNAPMNFNQFRNRISLTLNFDNDTEKDDGYSKASPSEDEDFNIDSTYLAKTSSDSCSNSNSKSVSRDNSVMSYNENNLQVDDDGTLSIQELGERIDFGSDGIRKNKSAKAGKLQMRERLVILGKLGAGASSIVYKALDLVDLRLVALKIIKVDDKAKRSQMIRELTSMYQILKQNSIRRSGHLPPSKRPDKFIVDFYDAFSNLEDGVVCFMMEYMDGGSLQDIADQGGCANEITLANIAIQSLKGIKFLHDSCQIHRDLKPANFLISHKGEVKVADLGLLKQLPQKSNNNDAPSLQKTNSFVGTAAYMSPERIDGKPYSFSADIWSFGLSLMCLAQGRFPIASKGGYWSILSSIRDSPIPSLPSDKFSPEFIDFLDSCLKRKPEDRATAQQLIEHPFLKKVQPEDLKYETNIDIGCEELESILEALFLHISVLKNDIKERYKSYDEYVSNINSNFDKLFGNLWSDSVFDIIKKLIFNDKDKTLRFLNTSQRSVTFKVKLFTLANQLHLPLEKVILEARNFLQIKEQNLNK